MTTRNEPEVTDVSERSSAGSGADRSLGQKVKRTVESKILIPLAATAVSAGVSYLAKKLPVILEEKVLPKLREKGAPELAKKVEAVASVLPGETTGEGGQTQAGSEQQGADAASAASDPKPTNDDREAERREREQRRRERKRALSSA